MVRSKLTILSSYEQAATGTSAHGFVSAVDARKGVTVTFYDGVFGRINASELAIVGVDDCTAAYQVGQSIACRVISCHGKYLKLTLDSIGDEAIARAAAQAKVKRAEAQTLKALAPPVGTLINGTVIEGNDDFLLVRISTSASESDDDSDDNDDETAQHHQNTRALNHSDGVGARSRAHHYIPTREQAARPSITTAGLSSCERYAPTAAVAAAGTTTTTTLLT